MRRREIMYSASKMQRKRRLLSMGSTTLEEVITVYEKLKKGQNETQPQVFRHSNFGLEGAVPETDDLDEIIPHLPSFNPHPDPTMSPNSNNHLLGNDLNSASQIGDMSRRMDFNKYRFSPFTKYHFFSEPTELLQANELEGLSSDYRELLQGRHYWLNILNPNEKDLQLLIDSYSVHDLSIADIREGNTEEKVEIFRHYTFISLRFMGETIDSGVDMCFNCLIFSDFIITTHCKEWANINDILGFLYLLSSDARTELKPEWVLFSVFIELSQDAKFFVRTIEPVIYNIRIGSKSLSEMSSVMRRNFDMEIETYKTDRFLKSMINILRQLRGKCSKRLSEIVLGLFSDLCEDLRTLSEDVSNFNHILERSQDTCLALANVELSRQANIMSVVMNRVSEVALVFLPVQAIAGFFGMNVRVPFQGLETTWYFWGIVTFSVLLAIFVYIRSRQLSDKSTPPPISLPGTRSNRDLHKKEQEHVEESCGRRCKRWILTKCLPSSCQAKENLSRNGADTRFRHC